MYLQVLHSCLIVLKNHKTYGRECIGDTVCVFHSFIHRLLGTFLGLICTPTVRSTCAQKCLWVFMKIVRFFMGFERESEYVTHFSKTPRYKIIWSPI
jgi:hypothetical protein